jgi:hypothetical protein
MASKATGESQHPRGGESQHPRGGESQHPRATGEDDVEGHSMLPNSGLNRGIAQGREREIERKLSERELQTQARRLREKGR